MSALMFNREMSPAASRPLTVIVLDDDRFDRKRMTRWVKASAHSAVTILEAADLGQFSALVRENNPDLMFMDYQLADGDGLDAIEIYTESCGNPGAYLIMVSGAEDPERAHKALMSGCDRYVTKSELTESSVAQFLSELRGTAPAMRNKPHPDMAAMTYWVARARRRSALERDEKQSQIPRIDDHDPNATLFGEPPKVWSGDWSGARAFMTEFFNYDEIEFLTRKRT